MNNQYYKKYIKYKLKYIELFNNLNDKQIGGNDINMELYENFNQFVKILYSSKLETPVNYIKISRLFNGGEYYGNYKYIDEDIINNLFNNKYTFAFLCNILMLLDINLNYFYLRDDLVLKIKKYYESQLNNGEIYNEEEQINLYLNEYYNENLNNKKSTSYGLSKQDFYSQINIDEYTYIKKKQFMSDEFIKYTSIWYKPYYKEYFWEMDLDKFIDEYDKFKITNQSFNFFWTNLLNFSIFFIKTNICNYFIQSRNRENPKITLNNKNEFIYYSDTNSYISKTNNEYFICKMGNWNIYKNKFIDLLIKSLDCNYDNIKKLNYEIICYVENNKNFEKYNLFNLPPFISYKCLKNENNLLSDSQILDKIGIKYNNDNNNIENIINDFKLFDEEYIYLSFNNPNIIKFTRHEFTKFIPSTLNILYDIDGSPLDFKSTIGHDFTNHNLANRKKLIDDTNPDIKNFICIIMNNNWNFLPIVHYLYHEGQSSEPFSYKTLKELYKSTNKLTIRSVNFPDELINDTITLEKFDKFIDNLKI